MSTSLLDQVKFIVMEGESILALDETGALVALVPVQTAFQLLQDTKCWGTNSAWNQDGRFDDEWHLRPWDTKGQHTLEGRNPTYGVSWCNGAGGSWSQISDPANAEKQPTL